MKRRVIAGVISFGLVLSMLLSLSGCGTSVQATNLMEGIKAKAVNTSVDPTGSDSTTVADFAVRLLQDSAAPGKYALISPLSALCALAMTANGAKGETLAQMEGVLGLSLPELNNYLHAYLENLPTGDKYKVSMADSIWLKDDDKLTVEPEFLQTNANYYGASIYKAAFDVATLKDINNWVSENTDGMIKDILDEIPDEAVMYLINTLAFDAEWEDIYRQDQVRHGTFTTESGQTRDVEMMYCTESRYLDDGRATGFLKFYADRKYAFAALLPNEGISVDDYVSSLSGDGLMKTLSNAQDAKVQTELPKFKNEFSVEMSDILKGMGMLDAFNVDLADFTGLGQSANGNIFISRVLQKTHIAVDERGTKAGAATVVEMQAGSAPLAEPKIVYLDRPFVYMVIDCKTSLPIFIGTMMDTGE